MMIVRRGSRTPLSSPDSRSRNSSSGSSLGVAHGVGDDQPMLTSWCHGVSSTTFSLTFWQYVDFGEDRVDLEVVVVARHQVDRDAAALEPFGGEGHPLADAMGDQVGEMPADERRIGFHRGTLRLGDPERVVAEVGDRAFQLDELRLGPGHPALAEDGRVPDFAALLAADDRDEGLAGEVAGDDGGVDLVDVRLHRVQELAPAPLRRVDVAADVEAEGLRHGSGFRGRGARGRDRARRDRVRRPPIRPGSRPLELAGQAKEHGLITVPAEDEAPDRQAVGGPAEGQ